MITVHSHVQHTTALQPTAFLSALHQLPSPTHLTVRHPLSVPLPNVISFSWVDHSILRLKCDGTRLETRFRLSAKRTSPFKSAGALVKSTTGSSDVRTSDSNAGYTMFRGSVKGTGYPIHSPVSPFISPPVRHRVPSRFNWTVPATAEVEVLGKMSFCGLPVRIQGLLNDAVPTVGVTLEREEQLLRLRYGDSGAKHFMQPAMLLPFTTARYMSVF
jgi:hypothetical protein